MIFQQDIRFPKEGQPPIQIGTIGFMPIVLERTGCGLLVATHYASLVVSEETPEAVRETAKRLVNFLVVRHPELLCV